MWVVNLLDFLLPFDQNMYLNISLILYIFLSRVKGNALLFVADNQRREIHRKHLKYTITQN